MKKLTTLFLIVLGFLGFHYNSWAYTCSTKRYCSQMTSCEEAMFYYKHCGLTRLDGDGDGIPCERLCKGYIFSPHPNKYEKQKWGQSYFIDNKRETRKEYRNENASAESGFKAKVIKVSDGDTVWIWTKDGRKFKVRIWGIDTPEKFESRKLFRDASRCGVTPDEIKHLGRLASRKAKELLDRSWVRLKTRGRGYYGRVLGIIYLPDGTNFGLEMIKEGYACVYRKNYEPEYHEALWKAQKEHKGLWSLNYKLMECLCY